MFADCQEWRRTVEGVGIDELYRTLDPFDVSFSFLSFFSFCGGASSGYVFNNMHSTLNAKRSLSPGHYGFIRYVVNPPAVRLILYLQLTALSQTDKVSQPTHTYETTIPKSTHSDAFSTQKGRSINVQTLGRIDMPELYKHISPERFWQTLIVTAECGVREILPAASRAAGRPIDKGLCIVDLKGFR
jgi:hypothetical protein